MNYEGSNSQNQNNQEPLGGVLEFLSIAVDQGDNPRSIELCHRALDLIQKDQSPELWASLHDQSAKSLMQNPLDDRSGNIEKAIHHYKQALKVFTRLAFPLDWAAIQINLAKAYMDRILGNRAKNIERAIYHLQQTLYVYNRQEFPEHWGVTQINLGEGYRNRTRGDRAKNLEQAIQHYQRALGVCNRQDFPVNWATIQNNLAIAFANRILGDRADNIEQAIHYFHQALEVRTRQTFPKEWADTQNNLGNTYRYRVHGDRAANIELSISHLQQALEARIRQDSPAEWASTQNNLATAYSERIRGDPMENIELAIHHYQQALEVRTRRIFPYDWATTQNNLGVAYTDRKSGEREENIERAIHHLKQALEVRTQKPFPVEWAMTQNNLAVAYAKRIRGLRAENVELSIHHSRKALNVYTHVDFPYQWALTQNNLATLYSERPHVDQGENFKLAINHYRHALEVLTPQAAPSFRRKIAHFVGKFGMENSQWEIAAEFLNMAVEADSILFESAFLTDSRENEIAEARNLYVWTAYALSKTKKLHQALETLEAGRVRLLREVLEQNRRDIEGLREAGRVDLLDRYRTMTAQLASLRFQYENFQKGDGGFGDIHSSVKLQDLEAASIAIQSIIGEIRNTPGFKDFLLPFGISKIQSLAVEVPMIYLFAAPAGGLALIVYQQSLTPIWLDNLTEKALREKIQGPDEDSRLGGLLGAYANWLEVATNQDLTNEIFEVGKQSWWRIIDETTLWMWDACIGQVIEMLINQGHDRAVFIPNGLLGLLPLHAAWTKDPVTPTGRRYALDNVRFTYAPSAHVLLSIQDSVGRPVKSLLAVDNPDSTLMFSTEEVAGAVNHFIADNVRWLIGEAASINQVKEEITRKDVLHFSTHGLADFYEPLDSFLLLANNESLTLRDILKLRLNSRLAVLSACETGIPGMNLPDEAIGLPTGFLQAGVAGVIGSLWTVNDASTMMLMTRFYDLWLGEGLEPTEALRQAQIWLRDTTNGEKETYFRRATEHYQEQKSKLETTAREGLKQIRFTNPYERAFAHPFYWAAFSYTGV